MSLERFAILDKHACWLVQMNLVPLFLTNEKESLNFQRR